MSIGLVGCLFWCQIACLAVISRLWVFEGWAVLPLLLPSYRQFPRAIRSWGIQWGSHFAIPFVLHLAYSRRGLVLEARHVLAADDQAIGLILGFVDGPYECCRG